MHIYYSPNSAQIWSRVHRKCKWGLVFSFYIIPLDSLLSTLQAATVQIKLSKAAMNPPAPATVTLLCSSYLQCDIRSLKNTDQVNKLREKCVTPETARSSADHISFLPRYHDARYHDDACVHSLRSNQSRHT